MKTSEFFYTVVVVLVGVVAAYNAWPKQHIEAKSPYSWIDQKTGLIIESDRPKGAHGVQNTGISDPAKDLDKQVQAMKAIESFRKKLEESKRPMPEMETEFSHLVQLILTVESKWDSKAVGDKGQAMGIAQIWKIVVDDVNRFSKTAFTYKDRLDPAKSAEMIELYLDHYAQAYEKATGKKAEMETLARIWNGGPDGYKEKKTVRYWQKIKSTILDPL